MFLGFPVSGPGPSGRRALCELPQPTPSYPHSRCLAQGPQDSRRPATLTCEPRTGPSISPVTLQTPQRGDCSPLASPPHAASIPLPACGPASAAVASRALCCQSTSGEPIPDLLSAGRGNFLPPGRLMENRESEAPPPVRHRGPLAAPGQDCAQLAQVDVHPTYIPHPGSI